MATINLIPGKMLGIFLYVENHKNFVENCEKKLALFVDMCCSMKVRKI